MTYKKYHSLMEFINDYKQYYNKNEFNMIFHDFITWFLHVLCIGKNDNILLYKYDDMIVICTETNKYEYVFFE